MRIKREQLPFKKKKEPIIGYIIIIDNNIGRHCIYNTIKYY
jgi:hypothetical protein